MSTARDCLRVREDPVRAWIAAWPGGAALGSANGELGAEYDLRRGRLWPLVLAALGCGPEIARRSSCR